MLSRLKTITLFRQDLFSLIFSKDKFLHFWLKDNYLVPVWTFDINTFCTKYYPIKKRLKFWCNSAYMWSKYRILFGGRFIKMVCLALAAHMFRKSVVLFAITSKKDLQARIFTNIYSFVCRKSFHFFSYCSI